MMHGQRNIKLCNTVFKKSFPSISFRGGEGDASTADIILGAHVECVKGFPNVNSSSSEKSTDVPSQLKNKKINANFFIYF